MSRGNDLKVTFSSLFTNRLSDKEIGRSLQVLDMAVINSCAEYGKTAEHYGILIKLVLDQIHFHPNFAKVYTLF